MRLPLYPSLPDRKYYAGNTPIASMCACLFAMYFRFRISFPREHFNRASIAPCEGHPKYTSSTSLWSSCRSAFRQISWSSDHYILCSALRVCVTSHSETAPAHVGRDSMPQQTSQRPRAATSDETGRCTPIPRPPAADAEGPQLRPSSGEARAIS